jgi:CubicO group peptidase (beta-lactamase class C family)
MKVATHPLLVRIALVHCLIGALLCLSALQAQEPENSSRLKDFGEYMETLLRDWNAPGVGVGIVLKDKLIFARGYGYRDYGKNLPFTPKTLCPVASNTKLFTAVAAGLLVEEGKLQWDQPVRDSVPSIRFYNDELNSSVTLRDMLAHRTGITRHDSIWYKSDFTRKELFERLKFMEPTEPIRQLFLYNNMMYAAVGYMIELNSGKTWEEFVRERILRPLVMNSSVFSIADMTKASDFGVPFTEKRDSTDLHQIPFYEEQQGIASAGALISNVEEMSHWLIALMNDGRYLGNQVLPTKVLKATLDPAIALRNVQGEALGFWEVLNAAYGMGRQTASYRGHLLTYHGGAIGGFFSQISFMPQDHIGVVVLVIGRHCASLNNIISYHIYERLLGLDETPWSQRLLEIEKKGKKAATEARAKAGVQKVPDTKPSHRLEAYAGEYEHPAYGILKIGLNEGKLQFDFHKIHLPLAHFHYDRFDTPDDELDGKWSVNFATSPLGDVDRSTMSLDEAEAVFMRKPATPQINVLEQLAGTYETPTGYKFQVLLKQDGSLYSAVPGRSELKLLPYQGLKFRLKEFSDQTWEFVMETGRVTALKQVGPSGEYIHKRKE